MYINKLLFLVLVGICFSCGSMKRSSSSGEEGQLVTTRKFAGVFIDYRYTATEDLPRTDLIWIKTSLESRYGKICASGKKCEFTAGDRLYLTMKFYSPGMVSGKYEYYIENDSSVTYQLTEYQSDHEVFTESWFK